MLMLKPKKDKGPKKPYFSSQASICAHLNAYYHFLCVLCFVSHVFTHPARAHASPIFLQCSSIAEHMILAIADCNCYS